MKGFLKKLFDRLFTRSDRTTVDFGMISSDSYFGTSAFSAVSVSFRNTEFERKVFGERIRFLHKVNRFELFFRSAPYGRVHPEMDHFLVLPADRTFDLADFTDRTLQHLITKYERPKVVRELGLTFTLQYYFEPLFQDANIARMF